MPWRYAGSDTTKHLVFGRADEHADDIFDLEGDDAVYEQLLDRLFADWPRPRRRRLIHRYKRPRPRCSAMAGYPASPTSST